MNSRINLEVLEQWCQDAITFLPTPELPKSIEELRRAIVRQSSGKVALYEVAADLAEGLSFLPDSKRLAAQESLINRYGFDHQFFIDARFSKLKRIIRNGKIKGEGEYRDLADLATDTTLSPVLRNAVSDLIAEYESKEP